MYVAMSRHTIYDILFKTISLLLCQAMNQILQIISSDQLDGYSKIRKAFKENSFGSSDEEIYKETSLVLHIKDITTNPIKYNGKTFEVNDTFLRENNGKPFDILIKHYDSILEDGDKVEWVINYLKKNPYSKRAILNFWKHTHSDLQSICPCLIYFWFRLYEHNKLLLIAHLRANDVHNKMLINFYMFTSIQIYVADKLGWRPGNYYHYTDSAHIYMKDTEGFTYYERK